MKNYKMIFAQGVFLTVASLTIAWIINANFAYMYNVTDSHPARHFFVFKTKNVAKGDLVVAVAPEKIKNAPFVVKRIKGASGDVISVVDRDVYVERELIGEAKVIRRNGETLTPIKAKKVAAGQYFLALDAANSFDSRYQEIGLFNEKDIVGIAYPIF